MQAETSFYPLRVYLLIRNTIVLNRATILIISAALTALLFLVSLFDASDNCSLNFHRNLYLAIFFPGGIFLTSRIFKGLHDPVKGISWLLLPASVLEKTLSQILLSTLIYITISMMSYMVFSMISEGLNRVVFNRCHSIFNPFDPVIVKSMLTYITIQSPFLVGAIYFQKHSLSKTILSLFGFLLMIGLGIGIAVRLIFGEQLSGFDFQVLFYSSEHNDFTSFSLGLIFAAKVFFWFVVPTVSWAICYFRIKETER